MGQVGRVLGISAMDTERIVTELQKLNTRSDRTDAVLATLDGRVGRIEVKVDDIIARLDGHDGRFEALDKRLDQTFESIDKRFEQVDKRFEQVDRRFEQVDKRFAQVDRRFEQVDRRFEQVDRRFERIEATLAEHSARMDTLATGQDVRDEGERTRNYMRVLYEDLHGQIRLIAEGHGALADADARTNARVDALEDRTTRLELAEDHRKRSRE